MAFSSTLTFSIAASNISFLLQKPSVHHHLSQKCKPLKRNILCCSFPRPEYIPNRISDDSYVRVLDTTLRDGEQAPGASMTAMQKLDVARQLAKLGVDIMETGFPASSVDDLEATKMIAMEVGNTVDERSGHVPVISACARCIRSDVEAAWEALKYAKRPRVNIFISTSEIHMKYKLKKTAEEVLQLAKDAVSYARFLGFHDIEFVCEDAGRSDKEFLYCIYGEAIKAGATTITFTDTVGYNFPNEVAQFIADMKASIVGIENVVIAIHCHNDLGLANANTLAAAEAGARQVEVTINGIGERAGNASLEEFVMAVKCRGKDILGGLHTGINTKHITTASKMVEEYSGFTLQPHKAIVGSNVFSHASGIHQDGILKNKSTYEIILAEDIGLTRSIDNGIVLGKHSGRHALKSRLLELGYDLDEKKLDDIFADFKAIAGRKKCVSDKDIRSLVSKPSQSPMIWKLGELKISSTTYGDLPIATVKLIDINGLNQIASAEGVDQIIATYNAIDLVVKIPVKLLEHSTNIATANKNKVAARVTIAEANGVSSSQKTISTGNAEGDDVVTSSALAYIDALDKLVASKTATTEKALQELNNELAPL